MRCRGLWPLETTNSKVTPLVSATLEGQSVSGEAEVVLPGFALHPPQVVPLHLWSLPQWAQHS